MAKSFNLSSKSDMRKLEKAILKDAKSDAAENIRKHGIEIECPHCSKKFKAHVGKNVCPFCKSEVNVEL